MSVLQQKHMLAWWLVGAFPALVIIHYFRIS